MGFIYTAVSTNQFAEERPDLEKSFYFWQLKVKIYIECLKPKIINIGTLIFHHYTWNAIIETAQKAAKPCTEGFDICSVSLSI